MVCKSCNTRVRPSDRHCPNCGRATGLGASLSDAQPLVSLDSDPAAAEGEAERTLVGGAEAGAEVVEAEETLPPGQGAIRVASRVPVRTAEEVELGEEQPASRGPAGAPEPGDETVVVRPPAPARKRPRAAPASYAIFTLHPEELRARIVEKPGLIEAGLAVYCDPGSGRPVGVGLASDVGEIDLLGVDEAGALVVVMVAERAEGDPVGRILEQLGWVAKHVTDGDRAVRAIVLLEPPPPALGYAARALVDSVSFKTWRVAVAIEDVEL